MGAYERSLTKEQLSTKEVEAIFGVTNRTVVNWKQGILSYTKLPHKEVKMQVRSKVYFEVSKLVDWAVENEIWDGTKTGLRTVIRNTQRLFREAH